MDKFSKKLNLYVESILDLIIKYANRSFTISLE